MREERAAAVWGKGGRQATGKKRYSPSTLAQVGSRSVISYRIAKAWGGKGTDKKKAVDDSGVSSKKRRSIVVGKEKIAARWEGNGSSQGGGVGKKPSGLQKGAYTRYPFPIQKKGGGWSRRCSRGGNAKSKREREKVSMSHPRTQKKMFSRGDLHLLENGA